MIRTQYEPDLPKVSLDVDLFRQALLNLFINARQAMPDGGELILRTRSEDHFDILEVTDTGAGMSPDVAARVFDAFYSTRPAGTGLGLPTTRKIIEAHGGTIRVEGMAYRARGRSSPSCCPSNAGSSRRGAPCL